MPRDPAALAKLTRPKLFGVVPRERLYGLIDQRLTHPAVWIAGPPGYGKTTLLASYIEARKRPSLWYQIDSGDADVATFFYYLGLAAGRFDRGRSPKALPALTPEYLPDLPGFTRRFFRALFARLPPSALLVLDNYEEVAPGSPLHSVLACALAELPEGVHVAVTSRAEPPPELARLVSTGGLTVVGWNELRLTAEETTAIAASRHVKDASIIAASHERSDGWVTGLILLLGQPQASGARAASSAASPQALFQYFAGVLFTAFSDETRHVLLATAFLRRVTGPMAERLSGDEHAAQRLRQLYEQSCFVDRRMEAEPTYQLHALFRDFLLDRVTQQYSPSERLQLVQRSAETLASFGQNEEAAALYGEAGDWTKAIELILSIAPQLLMQGRWQTLQSQIAALPRDRVKATPWLLYWLGASQAAVDSLMSRATLIAASEGFAASHDALGQILSAAAIMETYYVIYDDMVLLDSLIAALERLLAENPAFPNAETEVRILSSLVPTVMFRAPQHPKLQAHGKRLLELTRENADPTQRVISVTALLQLYSWLANMEGGREVHALARPLFLQADVPPLRKAFFLTGLAYWAQVCGDYDEQEEIFARIFAITAEHGLGYAEFFMRVSECWRHLDRGDSKPVTVTLRKLEAQLNPARSLEFAAFHHVKSWLALVEGNLALARQAEETSLAAIEQSGATYAETFILMALAEVQIELGEYRQAADSVARFRAKFSQIGSAMFEFHPLLVEAYAALRQGDEARCAETLSAAFAIGRVQGYVNNLRWYATMMSRLCGFALAHDIQTEYTRMLIQRRGLIPDEPLERWPWPVRIYTLGRFGLVLDDQPFETTRKAQNKPLALLKALIAFGGRDISANTLSLALWPEEGGGAQSTFDSTLFRLRKLLGSDEVLQLHDGRLTLDPQRVWVDAWTLERQLTVLDAELRGADVALPQLEAWADSLLHLYRGHFLQHETEMQWMLAFREKLKSKFLRTLLALGDRLERGTLWDASATLYERGLELDDLAEELYRRLMRCHQQRGQNVEAIKVYRRCRDHLSIVLGVKPSAETDAMHRRSFPAAS